MSNEQENILRGYGILIERVIYQNDIIIENMRDMVKMVSRIPNIEADVRQLKQDMVVVKFAITETNKEMRQTNKSFDRRITKLEKQHRG